MAAASTCRDCGAGVAGPGNFTEAVATRGRLETPMGCGCGGYVSHAVLACGGCGRWFLTAYEEHRPPSSEDFAIFEIDDAEAAGILAAWAACPAPEDRDCDCAAHRASESLHWPDRTAGTRRYFVSTPPD